MIIMGYCSYCGNWVDEGSTCSHCGGGGSSRDDNEDFLEALETFEEDLKENGYYDETDPIAYTPEGSRIIKRIINKNEAESCSRKGDHLNSIKFYRISLKATDDKLDQCSILSSMAREYEEIEDYTSAEEYWERCCETSCRAFHGYCYEYIALKGDFLYRRDRFKDAIVTYDEALMELKSLKSISFFMLKSYARITHFIISSYRNLGRGDMEEKYHGVLKDAIEGYISFEKSDDETKAHYLSRTAWEIYEDEKITDEALILLDRAIELHPTPKDYERKAIFIRKILETSVIVKDITSHDLDMINEALKILPNDRDNAPYLKVKADILDLLGDPVKAKICRALAYKDYDGVDKAEKQLKKLRSGGTCICITGVQYYRNFAPFKEGVIVDLIREPDNPHDMDAIRAEIDGETVGYVANNKYTVIKGVKSAAEIKNTGSTRAKVEFILLDKWVVARLI